MKVFLIINIVILTLVSCRSLVVRIESGRLVGTTHTLLNNRVVHAFLGIPYAAPPTGRNRFKEPQPVKSWYGIRNSTYIRNSCLQFSPYAGRENSEPLGNEDCLYLNVFTPKIPKQSEDLMNVMVYIHGGGFMFGNGQTITPEYIMQNNDLVFVSINYRLGILGFFSTNDRVAPGNNGLKDQVAALKWVKRNIRNFGGDPDKVTLFGNSAGGASVHYHYFSPLSEGLFRNGISSSGSVLNPWARPTNVAENSIQLASLIGCSTHRLRATMSCLRRKPAKQIINAMKNFQMKRDCPFTPFGPVVEPYHHNAFLAEDPLKILKNKHVRNVPLMFGLVEKEGLIPGKNIISNDTAMKELNDKWYEIAPNLLQYNYSVPESQKNHVSSIIKQFYFSNNEITRENAELVIQMLSDRLFVEGVTTAAKLQTAAVSPGNVYCYNFMYRGNFIPHPYGTEHSVDQLYVINYDERFTNKTAKDIQMTQLMTSTYIAFMNNGDPNIQTTKWLPITKDNSITCFGIHSPDDHKMEDIVGDCRRNEFWKILLPFEYPECPC